MPANDSLTAEDQISAALNQLLAEGLLWREAPADRRAYNIVAREFDRAAAQLLAQGWSLIQRESIPAFQIVHPQGKHRRRLSRHTALGLLIVRLLYSETVPTLTHYPVVSLNDVARRCGMFSLTLDLGQALPELADLNLIRPAGSSVLRPTNPNQLIELLPTLELAVPDWAIDKLYRTLAATP